MITTAIITAAQNRMSALVDQRVTSVVAMQVAAGRLAKAEEAAHEAASWDDEAEVWVADWLASRAVDDLYEEMDDARRDVRWCDRQLDAAELALADAYRAAMAVAA